MQNLNLNLGMQSFILQDGCPPLRFRPDDVAIYARFMDSLEPISKISDEYEADIKASSNSENENAETFLRAAKKHDLRVKQILTDVFGSHNDFDKILGGISLFNETDGKSNIEIIMDALLPLFDKGINDYADTIAGEAAEEAHLNREQRRALEHGRG